MSIGSMKRGLYPMVAGGGATASSTGSWRVLETPILPSDGTFTGFAAGAMPAFTINWEKVGNLVILTLEPGGTYTGTSDATGFTITALPAAITPTATLATNLFQCTDAGSGTAARCSISSSNTITFQKGVVTGANMNCTTTGWTNSGTKGLSSTWQLIYALA